MHPVITALHQHLQNLHALVWDLNIIRAHPMLNVHGTPTYALDLQQTGTFDVEARPFFLTVVEDHTTSNHTQLAAQADHKRHTQRLQEHHQALCASLHQLGAALQAAQPPCLAQMHTNTIALLSSVDLTGAKMRISTHRRGGLQALSPALDAIQERATLEHLMMALVHNTPLTEGTIWRVMTSSSHWWDIYASNPGEALEWAALFFDNTLLTLPTTPEENTRVVLRKMTEPTPALLLGNAHQHEAAL